MSKSAARAGIAALLLVVACDEIPTTEPPMTASTVAEAILTVEDQSYVAGLIVPYHAVLGVTRSAPGVLASGGSCTNGSMTDCNPAGATLNPAAAFVDPSPPAGYQQCAGFINTPADDVRWDWENNCLPFTAGPLFLRVYDHATGAIIAGGRLHSPAPLPSFWSPTGFDYLSDAHEGAGFGEGGSLTGVSLAWHHNNANFCGCSRTGGGVGTCNDVFAGSAAQDAIFYVGGNSSNHAYEAVWGPPGPKNTCFLNNETTALSVALYAEQPVILVDLDIKPGSDDNPINLRAGKGVTPVAVYSTDGFDATTIAVGTVVFGPGAAVEAHGTMHVEDVNGDGLQDAVFHFVTGEIGLACGDTSATLTGQTAGGADIEGTDTVWVRGPGC